MSIWSLTLWSFTLPYHLDKIKTPPHHRELRTASSSSPSRNQACTHRAHPLMTLQSLSPCQAPGVPGTRHPAHLHAHVPSRLRAVHGWTGENILAHSWEDVSVAAKWLMINFKWRESVSGCGSVFCSRSQSCHVLWWVIIIKTMSECVQILEINIF